ncbi:MAG: ExbD/TolR family protein [Terriglobia bacterium]
MSGDAAAPVYIRADQAVPYGVIAGVMDALEQANVTNVSLVTQPLRTKRAK